MGRLFGTDGARGVANAELTCEMAMNIGRAAAMVLTNDSRMRPKILIGKDTRFLHLIIHASLTALKFSAGTALNCPMRWRNKLKPSCWIILIRMIVPQAAELAALPVKRMR